jgi:ribose transport system substrate-binding protein
MEEAMKKKSIVLLVLAVCMMVVFVACTPNDTGGDDSTETPAAATEENTSDAGDEEATGTDTAGLKIGYILSGPDIYYEQSYRVFEALASEAGWEITKTASDYDPKKETNNVQDMIAKGVDIIVLNDVTSSNGASCAKLAAEANIPMFFVTTLPDDTEGVTASCSGAWYQCGEAWAEWMWDKTGNNKDAKFVLIEGAYGQGTTELIRLGFLDKFGELAGKSSEDVFNDNIIFNQTGQWQTDQAVNVMQDAMAKTGGDFDGILVANEAMLLGVQKVIQGFEDKYWIATENGYEETVTAIQSDPKLMTVSCPATAEGEIVFEQIKAYKEGIPFPKYVKCPYVVVDSDTVKTSVVLPYKDDAEYISWVKSDKTGINVTEMEDSGSTDPDWSGMVELNGAKSS